jgi:hypothetical protein
MQKFKRDPTVGLKVLVILTRHSSLAEETSSSSSNDSIATLNRPQEKHAKISVSNDQIKSYGYFNPLLKSGRPHLLVTELGFHINPKGKQLQETRAKI